MSHKVFFNATVLNAQGQWQRDKAFSVIDGLFGELGDSHELKEKAQQDNIELIDCTGQFVTPGLIDCHTHCVYYGNRADEFRQRLNGVTYTEIAQQGGGIQSTVRATRSASIEQLIETSLPRMDAMIAQGVSTLEIKSGYGLDTPTERKMLQVAKRLGELRGIRVFKTFLGAHALPPEFRGRSDDYVAFLCQEMLPSLHEDGLVDAVDVFCETIAFNLQQTQQVFEAACALGLPIKCHAEQLSDSGAARLAAEYGALSCDHMEYASPESIRAMADNDVTAVLLPGAYYFLRETKKPPIDLLRENGVAMAIATDANPGSSPTTSLLLMLNMACTLFDLSVEEALQAVMTQAAKALGLSEHIGEIAPGKTADFVVWQLEQGSELCYQFGAIPKNVLYVSGERLT